jgi:hypothetical protein
LGPVYSTGVSSSDLQEINNTEKAMARNVNFFIRLVLVRGVNLAF